jgi:ribonucleotide monophosphatase NagD (HAD superfamily)
MVGDRINTDIAFGQMHGLRTVLVLSGCTPAETVLECLEGKGQDGIELEQ